jgi:transposase
MTKAYSLDLRVRVVRFVEGGRSRHAAAAHFDVSVAFVVKLVAAWRETGSLAPKPEGGWRYSKLDPHRDFLVARVAEKADMTMPELAAELAGRGTIVAPSSLARWLIRHGYRFKKNAAGQRARPA